MRDGLDAAQAWGSVRPSALLMTTPAMGDWSEVDKKLAMAWHLDRAARCPGGCGQYMDEAHEVDGWHEAHTTLCDGCAARDRKRNELSARPEPGRLVYVTKGSAAS